MAPCAWATLGAPKVWLCPGQGHTGGLGKGGTQGLNGCGVKQMFKDGQNKARGGGSPAPPPE